MKSTDEMKDKNLEENQEASENNSINTLTKQVEWSVENELIMVEWCDIAQCYKWLNTRAHNRYSKMHALFTIPTITLSTITGTASFAQASLPVRFQTYAPMIIGTINILIGILTTIQQYLKISELNEAHRVSAISWDKFSRNIRTELAKAPNERMDAGHFLKLHRLEFDRLMETSPSIPLNVISDFNRKFSGKPGSEERKRYEELKKPDICNSITSSNQNRHHWYKNINHNFDIYDVKSNELKSNEYIIQSKLDKVVKHQIQELLNSNKIENNSNITDSKVLRNSIVKFLSENDKNIDFENKVKLEHNKIDKFVEYFEKTNGKRPLQEDIKNVFQNEIDDNIMNKYLENYIALSSNSTSTDIVADVVTDLVDSVRITII